MLKFLENIVYEKGSITGCKVVAEISNLLLLL